MRFGIEALLKPHAAKRITATTEQNMDHGHKTRGGSLLALLIPVFILSACGGPQLTPEVLMYKQQHKAALAKIKQDNGKALADYKDPDHVLYNLRAGYLALDFGDYASAYNYLRNASKVVDSEIGANRGAVSVATWQTARYFKGARYERVALYYYVGLLAYLSEDNQIARASLMNAALVDKSSDEAKYQEDNAAVYYLLARVLSEMGDESNAAIALQKATAAVTAQSAPETATRFLTVPALANNNLVILVEQGTGPFRRTNENNAVIFSQYSSPSKDAEVFVDGVSKGKSSLLASWWLQGSTGGMSASDKLQAAKAVTASILNAGGQVCGICGLCAMACRASSKADLRAWRLIPDTIRLFSARVPSGVHRITLRWPTSQADPQKNVVADFDRGDPPKAVAVATQGGYLPAYEETHHYIHVGTKPTVIFLRSGFGKQAKRVRPGAQSRRPSNKRGK